MYLQDIILIVRHLLQLEKGGGGEITRTSSFIKLPLIKHTQGKHSKNTLKKHIAPIDLETYYNSVTGKNEVYSLGFAYGGSNVLISPPFIKTYYLEPGKKKNLVILC